MRGVKRCQESTGRMKKHRYSSEFRVTAVKMTGTKRGLLKGRAAAELIDGAGARGLRLLVFGSIGAAVAPAFWAARAAHHALKIPPDCPSGLGTGVTVDHVVGGCAKEGANRVPAGACWERA